MFSLKPQIGNSIISLYSRVPTARKTKPIMDHGWNSSPRKVQLQTQIRMVLEVSMVDLWAAEAYLVVLMPKTLNREMEQQIPIY